MAVKKSTKPAVDKAVEEKKPVATVKKVAKTVKDETVKAVAKATETAKAETAKAAETVKKETAKATEAVKKETAKATEVVKAEVAEKKETVKKATKKAAEKKPAKKAVKEAVNVAVQFDGKSYTTEELVKIAKDVWKYDLKKKATDFKTVDLYVKPEEALCYYVINGEVAGCFAI